MHHDWPAGFPPAAPQLTTEYRGWHRRWVCLLCSGTLCFRVGSSTVLVPCHERHAVPVPDGLEARSRDQRRLSSVPPHFGTVYENRCISSRFHRPSHRGFVLLISIFLLCSSTLCTYVPREVLVELFTASETPLSVLGS